MKIKTKPRSENLTKFSERKLNIVKQVKFLLRGKKIKDWLIKLPELMAEKALISFFALLLIGLIFAGFVFYKKNMAIENKEIELTKQPLNFNQNAYQDVLNAWQEREEKLKQIDIKTYPNPFSVEESKLTE